MSQKKTKLQELCEFLLSSLTPVIQRNNIDAWQERGTLILNGEDKGQDGYQVAKWKHTAVISIENFPHRRVNPYNILAMVSAFLLDSEWPRDEYGLADPEIDVDVVTPDNAMVLIDIELIDDIELIPDAKGHIEFNGERYHVSIAPIEFAQDVDVNVKSG